MPTLQTFQLAGGTYRASASYFCSIEFEINIQEKQNGFDKKPNAGVKRQNHQDV